MADDTAKGMGGMFIDQKARMMIDTITSLQWEGAIENDDQQANAANMLASIKTNGKDLKQKKEAITKPLNAALKEVRAQFKPAEDRLTELENTVKAALLQYHDSKEAAAEADIQRIQQKLKSGVGDLPEAMAELATIDQPQTDLGGAQIKYGPAKVRIIDPFMLPPHYLYDPEVIDALRKVVARDMKQNGVACPKGAKLVREKIVAGIAQ